MRVGVCLKQVPDDSARMILREDGRGLCEPECTWMLSPFDRYAIEAALRIRAAQGGECVALLVGPDRAPSVLTEALALGMDGAVHAFDALFEALDPLATARVLAATVKAVGPFDLLLAGQRGVGEDHGQVPGLLAEILDWPQATLAVGLTIEGGVARVVREVEQARETWELTLPAVVSAQKGLNEPRQKSLKGVLEAKKKPVRRLDCVALGLTGAELLPRLECVGLTASPPRRAVQVLEGSLDEQVDALVAVWEAEGLLP